MQNLNFENQWLIFWNVQENASPINWFIREKDGRRIMKMAMKLPLFNKGIPKIQKNQDKCFKMINSNGLVIYIWDRVVMILEKKILEFRYDNDFIIENEIYKSIPDNSYKDNISNMMNL